MSILPRYIFRSVFLSTLVVLLALLGLKTVFTFIGELEDLNEIYTVSQALLRISLTIPASIDELMPFAILLGAITGLGVLANGSELTIIRAAGISIPRILAWTLFPSILFITVSLCLVQFVIPNSQHAYEMHYQKMKGIQSGGVSSYWHREQDRWIYVNQVLPTGDLRDVVLFTMDAAGVMHESAYAKAAHYQQASGDHPQNGWVLQDVQTTSIATSGQAESKQAPEQFWLSGLTPDFLKLVTLDPASLSLTRLYEYAVYMQAQGLDAKAYFLQFWKKCLAPLAAIAMGVIACSFIFGPLRSVTMGLRIVTGVMVGLLFQYGQEFMGYVSLLYDFPPFLAASLPISVCLMVGTLAILKVR